MKAARAFAPGNISCVFKVVPNDDPAKMHSLGMGFTVNEGVTVTVRQDRATSVSFNGDEIDFPAVRTVVAKLTEKSLRVEIESPLPLGSGFGLSGASALAAAYALDALLTLGRPSKELAMAAHVAEVENLTGLGDVCAQFHGGCLAKLKPGDPLGAVPVPVDQQPIYYRCFGPIDTRSVIGSAERKARINRAAAAALARIRKLLEAKERNFNVYIDVSKSFATDSGLLTDSDVQDAIQRIEEAGGHASMIMLGRAVFSTVPVDGAREIQLCKEKARVL